MTKKSFLDLGHKVFLNNNEYYRFKTILGLERKTIKLSTYPIHDLINEINIAGFRGSFDPMTFYTK